MTQSRCEVLALSMPSDGSCLAIHVYTFHRSGCHLRAKIGQIPTLPPHSILTSRNEHWSQVISAHITIQSVTTLGPPLLHNIDTRFSFIVHKLVLYPPW